jgi:hypothetical protein
MESGMTFIKYRLQKLRNLLKALRYLISDGFIATERCFGLIIFFEPKLDKRRVLKIMFE